MQRYFATSKTHPELPEENAGCHKARHDKKWRNQKKSKYIRQ